MPTAKVFTSGRSQAVRLPKEFRFSSSEVYINKIGDALILTPAEKLPETFDAGLAAFTDDFLADALPEELPSERLEL